MAFRALRNTGLALSLGLTALAAYQGVRDAVMATPDQPNNDSFRRHLEAENGREIVFCHMCSAQWFRDAHGLICPSCEGEITEIISAESDPRPPPQSQRPSTPPEFTSLRSHYPFHPYGDDSDPEEADIDEHIRHGPDGFSFTRHTHSASPLHAANDRRRFGIPEDDVVGNFQSMIANMMGGPQMGGNPQGRSGVHVFTSGGNGNGPRVQGTRWTWSSNEPGRVHQQQAGMSPGLDELFGGIFGPMGPGQGANAQPGMPPGLAGLFASILNPANARSGDAVYTQEALDNIISQLMEQNASNAPGPATEDAINSLPKKKLDEEMLGPEHKGECSVCMDDVTIDDEVVVLPCKHWFHEQCASIWLKEHNTCPICRKGIEGNAEGSSSGQSQSQNQRSPYHQEEPDRFPQPPGGWMS